MLYFEEPTQVDYKFGSQETIYEGIAFLEQIIDLDTGALIDLAEVILVEIYEDNWKSLTNY